jgi:chitinase
VGKTKHIVALILCVLFLMSGGGADLYAQSNIWVTAYYAGWMQSYLPASAIDYGAMTHICHFALIPSANGSVNESGNSVGYNANTIALIDSAHRHGVKVLITVGGWSTQTDFQGAASGARATFIHNLMNIVRTRNYDGIDIDWEPLSNSDQTNYAGLAHDLRDSLNATNSNLLLTMATQWAEAVSAASYQYFNQVNLMTYDISGLWSGWVTWHNSPIYNDISIGSNIISCNGYVNSWVQAGVPIGKLGIGIDFYGYTYSGATGPRQSISGVSLIKSNDPYSNIMSTYYQSQYVVWDTAAQAAYLSIPGSPSKWVSYDNEIACAKKIEFARNKGIGGVIIWELGGGYRSSLPAGQRDPLLKAVKNAIGNIPVDTTKPTVAITSPSNGATVSGTVAVSASAIDNNGVVGVQFRLNGSNLGNEDFVSPYSYSWNTSSLTNGAYVISAIARDASGNINTASISVTVSNVHDTTAPNVSITSPANGASVSDVVVISAGASDNVGVVGVQFRLNGSNLGSEDLTSPYGYSWTTTNYTNGTYTLSAVARDAAGNSKTASISVTVSNLLDTIPPTVSITSLSDGSNISDVVLINATASDNKGVASVHFLLDGNNLGSQLTAPPYYYLWNTIYYANGSHVLTAVATDLTGNSSSFSIGITVHNNKPTPFDSIYEVVTTDDFDRSDELPVSGHRWTTLLNQPGNGMMQVVQRALQPYNGYGRYNAGGVAWDSLLRKGAGISIVIAQKVADNTYPPLFMYLRMDSKDLNTGNGYCFRYLESKTGAAELTIQRVTNGTFGTDLVTASDEVAAGDTLRFVVRNDEYNTLVAYINSRLVLSIVDTTYNPASWYAWLRGYILTKAPRFAHFSIVNQVVPIPLTKPAIPVLTSPEHSAQGVTCNPTVSWQESVSVASFRIQASMDSAFSAILVDQSDIQNTFYTFNGFNQATKYYWRVRGMNTVGTSDWSVVRSFVTATGTTLTYNLSKRWNLLSLPISTPYPRRDIQCPSAISSAYTYIPNAGYQSKDTLVNGKGYWLKFGANQQISFTGDPFVQETLTVIDGWNLIGSISSPIPAASIISNGTSVVSRFYGFNGGYAASDTVYPAKSYWVKVEGNGQLMLSPGGAVEKLALTLRLDDSLDGMNTITIEDASGNHQKLYFGTSEKQPDVSGLYDLPPVPPRGAFDARFSTNRFAEFIGSTGITELPIVVSTETYPVVIKLNARNLALCHGMILIDGREAQLDGDGSVRIASSHSQISLKFGPSSIAGLPKEFGLEQNYPNPFNPNTTIKYHLPVAGKVMLRLYNILGELVATLADEVQNAGYKSVEWNSGNCSSGVYFYRLDAVNVTNPAESYTNVRKMLLIK